MLTSERPLTCRQAAAALHITPGYLRQLARRGAVEGFQITERGDWHFPRESIAKLTRPKENGQ